jgi:GntR family transcriptional regulator
MPADDELGHVSPCLLTLPAAAVCGTPRAAAGPCHQTLGLYRFPDARRQPRISRTTEAASTSSAAMTLRSAFMAAEQQVPRPPSLYRKVAEDIKAAIAAGGYAAGTRLPSEHELAERYSVSRGTIRQAFAALRADGVIASRRGARRVVVGGPRVQSFGELLSFSRWARAMGEVPGGRVVAMRRRPANPAEAERLAIPSGAQVYHLTRVRLLSGHPVMIERGTYPDRVGVLVAGMDLEHESITQRLEELGVVFADAEHVIDAVPASAEDSRLLGVRPRVPMLRERRLTTDLAGVPVEWSDDRYLGGAVAFSVRNSVAVNALSRTQPRSGPYGQRLMEVQHANTAASAQAGQDRSRDGRRGRVNPRTWRRRIRKRREAISDRGLRVTGSQALGCSHSSSSRRIQAGRRAAG